MSTDRDRRLGEMSALLIRCRDFLGEIMDADCALGGAPYGWRTVVALRDQIDRCLEPRSLPGADEEETE